jgi:hypothetical protein
VFYHRLNSGCPSPMIEYFVGATEVTTRDLRLNDPLLFGFELNRHSCTPFRALGALHSIRMPRAGRSGAGVKRPGIVGDAAGCLPARVHASDEKPRSVWTASSCKLLRRGGQAEMGGI